MCKGMIADIQRASIHDGPCLRTTVFFKGCPLSCRWCHNPECISFAKQELFYPEKCIGCGRCQEGCYAGARVSCGTEMTAQQVLQAVLADRPYYGAAGGVTLSGGEPLAQARFAAEILKLCRQAGIHTAIETSLYFFDAEVLSFTDLIMADIKIFNSAKHREYTGADNEPILKNLQRADTLGIPLVIRTPIIPTVNDTVENIRQTRDFIRCLKNVIGYELLPYHPLGFSKAKALGVKQQKFEIPQKEKMEELRQYADLSR